MESERIYPRMAKDVLTFQLTQVARLKLKFADSLESRGEVESRNFSNVELLVRRSRFTGWLGFTFPRPSDDLCQRPREIDAPENERERERGGSRERERHKSLENRDAF